MIVGCGYVGLPLGAELVRLGHEVFGLRRSASAENELKAAGIKPLVADITRPGELARLPRDFDWVVNCVSSTGGDAEDYRQVYLQGTRNLIEWLSAAPAEKIRLYQQHECLWPDRRLAGQGNQSDRTGGGNGESSPRNGKVAVGSGALIARFPAVILRVAGIYGPDRGHWFKQFLKNEARIEGDGSRFLNMIHRDDLIGCIIAALKSGRPGEIYNAVDDEPVSQVNFFQWLAATVGKYPPPSVPENPVENRKRGVTNKRVLNRRLKMELGYQFKYPNFRKGYSAELLRLERAGELHVTPDER